MRYLLLVTATSMLLGASHWSFVRAGVCSWFRPLPMYGAMRVCASNDVPSRTDLLVINDENGRESMCHVVGSGPFWHHRVLDVSPSVRDALGFSSLARVRIYREIR